MSLYTALMDRLGVRQTERLDPAQARNSAGGYVYGLDAWARLDRFLVLGSDAPTYYEAAPALTRENARVVDACWAEDAPRTAARIAEVSEAGRAPRVSPAIFALALGDLQADPAARRAALDALPRVCRTASHLFEFVSTLDALGRGWGRGLKRAVAGWYEARTPEALGYQMAKYRERNGYSHARLIRCAHPPAADAAHARVQLYRWACGREHDGAALPDVLVGHLAAMRAETPAELVPLIERHRLTWEAVPTWALKDATVWEALLPHLPLTALVRNLGALTEVGVIRPLGPHTGAIRDRLLDAGAIRAARLHPYALLQAGAVYRRGRAVKGARHWTPEPGIVEALDRAFYLAFDNVVPTGRRRLVALDVSGSMAAAMIGGVLSAREASAALSLVTARTEERAGARTRHVGFGTQLVDLDIHPGMDLGTVVRRISGLPFAGTDCAQPMLHALETGLEVDAFEVYTDNETWSGTVHPVEALRRYRRETGIPARLVVVGLTATGFSIADPGDGGMLDVVGFDAGAPGVMADFIRA